jgi:hypothetical protein
MKMYEVIDKVSGKRITTLALGETSPEGLQVCIKDDGSCGLRKMTPATMEAVAEKLGSEYYVLRVVAQVIEVES